MKTVTCENCNHVFVPPKVTTAGEALVSERRLLDVAPELREAELVACPKCGHKQRANTYLFFGFLTSKGLRVLLGCIIGGMLLFALWWGLLRN